MMTPNHPGIHAQCLGQIEPRSPFAELADAVAMLHEARTSMTDLAERLVGPMGEQAGSGTAGFSKAGLFGSVEAAARTIREVSGSIMDDIARIRRRTE